VKTIDKVLAIAAMLVCLGSVGCVVYLMTLVNAALGGGVE
jgi:hypothetical protein